MRVALFCHSIISDWNHGNAHFLRGVVSELAARGHDVRVYEAQNAWSAMNLLADYGIGFVHGFRRVYPRVRAIRYQPSSIDLARHLERTDAVLVHEWNEPALVARIGELKGRGARFRLLFHDTHHRAATDPGAIGRFDLRHYDGVLAFGAVIRDLYLSRRWARRAWTWHEGADARVFRPLGLPKTHDVVWIGNWGDGERGEELREFLIEPVRALNLRARVHGVRYPTHARQMLAEAGIEFGGWLPNYEVPRVLAQAKVSLHIPRRPYVEALPGIPTIRPFEALACASPLVCAPWNDAERLFSPGEDFLIAKNGRQMQRHLRALLEDEPARLAMGARGRRTVLARHTCAHRTDELLRILAELGVATEPSRQVRSAVA